ncbi:MAG: HAD-IIIC family phosphatase [Bacteroidales bacterium]|nr:HAD-IIIC family phosphatase [Bacteroidales bacterium]
MFDPQIYSLSLFKKYPRIKLNSIDINHVWMSIWEEHCTECAVPLCYNQCSVFTKRNDGKCSRIQNGIIRNYQYKGLLCHGLECSFNKWGKIESRYYPFSCSQRFYRLLASINYYIYLFLSFFDKIFHLNKNLSLLKKYRLFRNGYFLKHYTDLFPDAFYLECILLNKSSVHIIIQFDDNISNTVFYSKFHIVNKGINKIIIPFDEIRFDYSISPADYAARLRIFIAPINEESQTDIIFTYLNFISIKKMDIIKTSQSKYVKCVAWDLDNTIWNGIFSEIGSDVSLKEEAINTIKDWDNKGIINTIISKNDYKEIITYLDNIGMLQYFVLPAINWGSKSENIKKISSSLGISLDAFAFIDDNPHELNEMRTNCPNVRVYSIHELSDIKNLIAFNPPTSSFSKNRRAFYQAEIKRKQIYLSNFPNDYQKYLKQLDIRLKITPIVSSLTYDRCFELISRSNQYNLRTVRYTHQEFNKLVNNSPLECYAVNAYDKYGDYGIICFFFIIV